MIPINPLQTTLQNLYAQLGSNEQNITQVGRPDISMLHSLGLNAGMLQNLRHDLNAVTNGSNPDRALNRLLDGLQQFRRAKEWPAGKELPAGARTLELVKGENGQIKEIPRAQEWPAGKELPAGAKILELVKGENGQIKEIPRAQEWPAGKELPAGAEILELVKGENGQIEEIPRAQEWPAGKELPAGARTWNSVLQDSTSSVQGYADAATSSLKALLNAEAAGTGIAQASTDLRASLQALFSNSPLDSNPELVRDALRKSIVSKV